MFRLGVKEYLKNGWFNIVVVLIITAMMMCSAIFISNVDRQTRVYRLASKYVDENSAFVMFLPKEIRTKLKNVEKTMFSKRGFGEYIDDKGNENIVQLLVYDEEFMKYLKPRLDEGILPDRVDRGNNIISVAISKNPFGLKSGDSAKLKIIMTDDSLVDIEIYVSGLISEGQVMASIGSRVEPDMTYEDFFEIYSYGQTEDIVLVIPEEELSKLPKDMFIMYESGIIKFKEGITAEERERDLDIIRAYEKEYHNFEMVDCYPEAEKIMKFSDKIVQSILLKYVPLTISVFILVATCIAGMISIKTYRGARYYGILHICGMYYKKAAVMTGMGMMINCILSWFLCVVLMTLQKKYNVIGTINCEFSPMVNACLTIICVTIILLSAVMARRSLKKNTPIEVFKAT